MFNSTSPCLRRPPIVVEAAETPNGLHYRIYTCLRPQGLPFTESANLAETTIVLPPSITPDVINLYLAMMGKFATQTGQLVTDVTIAGLDGLKADATKDYIVLDIGADQPALRTLNQSLPVAVDSDGLHPRDPQGFFAPVRHAWWKLRNWENGDSSTLNTSGGQPQGLMEGSQWPAGSGRSVVLLSLRDNESTAQFLAAYLDVTKASDIAGSVTTFSGGKFTSYRIGDEVYYHRPFSPWTVTKLVVGEFPWLLALAVSAVSLLMALLVRSMLREKARQRLVVTA